MRCASVDAEAVWADDKTAIPADEEAAISADDEAAISADDEAGIPEDDEAAIPAARGWYVISSEAFVEVSAASAACAPSNSARRASNFATKAML